MSDPTPVPSPTPDEQAAEEQRAWWRRHDVEFPDCCEGMYPHVEHIAAYHAEVPETLAPFGCGNCSDHAALVVARERLAEAETQRDLLAQAMWNARRILGFDNDGDPGPGAAIAGSGYEGFARMHEREAAEARKDDDETFDLSMAYKERLAAVEALCDEADEAEAENSKTKRGPWWGSHVTTHALRAVLVGRPPTPHPTQEKP